MKCVHPGGIVRSMGTPLFFALFIGLAFAVNVSPVLAHAVTEGDKGYIMEIWG